MAFFSQKSKKCLQKYLIWGGGGEGSLLQKFHILKALKDTLSPPPIPPKLMYGFDPLMDGKKPVLSFRPSSISLPKFQIDHFFK
jgi:hypothetical protein